MNGDQDAVTRLIVSSEEGNNLSKSFLAILYLSDTGVKKDENKSKTFFNQSYQWIGENAMTCDKYSQCSLGICYQYGRGVSEIVLKQFDCIVCLRIKVMQ
jgi:TPR repeat protein